MNCERCKKSYEDPNNRKLCPSCRVWKWRQNIKRKAVDFLGGKCNICGYDKCQRNLEFHHKDPTQKDFNIAGSNNKSWSKIKTELPKCILVCSNCHGEIHDEIEQAKYSKPT